MMPYGKPYSDIMVISPFPHKQDIQKGLPYQSPTTSMVGKALEYAGFDLKNIRHTYYFWTEPPAKNMGYIKSRMKTEKNFFEEHILREISTHKPKYILALGEDAIKFCTGHSHITKRRGSVYPYIRDDSITVTCSLSPDRIRMNQWALTKALLSDCKKFYNICTNQYHIRERTFITKTLGATFYDMEAYLEKLSTHSGFLAYDIEGMSPRISAISFATDANNAISIPLNGVFTLPQEEKLLKLIRKVLGNPYTYKIAHNMIYDNYHLALYGIEVKNIFIDTLVLHHALEQELPHTLDFVTSIYTNENYYKDDRTMAAWDVGTQKDADLYSCKDSAVLMEIVNPLVKECQEKNLIKFYFDYLVKRIKYACRMQYNGMPYDVQTAKELRSKYNKLYDEAIEEIAEVKPVNPNSSKQLKELLYKDLKLKVQKNYKTKRPSTDSDSLKALMQMYPKHKKLLKLLLDARHYKHTINNYLKLVPFKNRLFYSLAVHGTETGRYKTNKMIDNSGVAAQTIPKEMRKMIRAESSDTVIFECDSSQAEARVVAWDAEETNLIKAFLEGSDIHIMTYAIVMDGSYDDIKDKSDIRRQIAKKIKHATNYGMGAGLLKKQINADFPEYPFSYHDAKRVIHKLDYGYPKTAQRKKDIDEQVRSGKRRFYNPYGRLRQFHGPYSNHLVKEATAFFPQSTVGDLAIRAQIEVMQSFEQHGFDPKKNFIFLVNHDSLVGHIEEKHVQTVKTIVQTALERPVPNVYATINNEKIPLIIPSEFEVGPSWGELEEI